jgi:hypothetical protein
VVNNRNIVPLNKVQLKLKVLNVPPHPVHLKLACLNDLTFSVILEIPELWSTNGGKCGDDNSYTDLNNFISELADQDMFKDVTRDKFAEIFRKTSRSKPTGVKKVKAITPGNRFIISSQPPAPKLPTPPSTGKDE